MRSACFAPVLIASSLLAAEYAAPAGPRAALRRPGAESILPGGRVIAPLGQQFITGPGPFGLAVSPSGMIIASANGGPERFSITVLEKPKKGPWQVRNLLVPRPEDKDHSEQEQKEDDTWRSVFMGIAFAGEHSVYTSDGNSGRVRLLDLATGSRRRLYNLNQGGFADSYTGDLALDAERGLLYVIDQANFRMVSIDVRKHQIVSSIRLGHLPFAIALSPDKRKAYVTNIGMFQYQQLPGADRKQARETGLPFPAFGFPSAEAAGGVKGETARGPVDIPALGDPNVRESNSVCVVNLADPAAPKIEAFVRTGLPFGNGSTGGSSPSAVVATADRVFVANAHNDSITVLDAKTNSIVGEVPIRVPGLEDLRGALPMGLAFHEPTGWLLVAEAGLNAVGIIDTKELRLAGHVPVGWFPTRVVIDRDTFYVTNAKGHGTGPSMDRRYLPVTDALFDVLHRGTISVFPLPSQSEIAGHTATVLAAGGFRPLSADLLRTSPVYPVPPGIRHVVLIVKENRTFDEVFGDIRQASNGPVNGSPVLARFGRYGVADGGRNRLSLQKIQVTPNHHAMATRWSFSDNFYADSEVSVDGHHWLVGSYPNAWTESSLRASYAGQKDFRLPTTAPGRLLFAQSRSSVHPEELLEAGTIWHHFERHGISFRNFGEGFELSGADEGTGLKPTGARYLTNVPMPDVLYRNTSRQYPGFNTNIPDQFRADQFIQEVQQKYIDGGEEFPQFVFMHLPNDHMDKPRREDGYPFEASYVADNDYALGRIVEFLSKTKWWREMAIFITEDDAQGGRDHIDSHRTVLLAVGPFLKKNYVSHVNASFSGLLKTIFRLLRLPPLNLFDAAASDLSDCFASEPESSGYEALPVDSRLFDPARAREPLDPRNAVKMDDPAFLRKQQSGKWR